MRKVALVGLIALIAVGIFGCVSPDVIVPPLDLQREIFLSQDANSRKLLDIYDAKLRRIVMDHARGTLKSELSQLTDPEGQANVADMLALFNAVDAEREKDLSALDQKKTEHMSALDSNKAAFLAIDLKLREYMQSGSLTPATVNQLTADLVEIYKQFSLPADRQPERSQP